MLLSIPISKGKDISIEIETDDLMDEKFPLDAFKEIMFQGLKQVLNRGMSKIGSTKGLDGKQLEDANQALLEVAAKNKDAMYKGEIRVTGGKAKTKGLQKAIKTEAMRLARLAIKDELKRSGEKLSHYSAKAITAAAEELLNSEQGAPFLEQAKENISNRVEAEKEIKIDVAALKPDPKLVAAAKEKAEKSKRPKKEVAAGVLAKARPQPGHHAN